jgi:hypothetical protein
MLQRNGHPLDLHRRRGHHVLKPAVFEVRDGVVPVGVLHGGQIFPGGQLVQIQCQLGGGVLRKHGVVAEQLQNGVFVQLVVHFLVLQVKQAHDGAVGHIIGLREIFGLCQLFQQISLQHRHPPLLLVVIENILHDLTLYYKGIF